jgi:hypothetical protein
MVSDQLPQLPHLLKTKGLKRMTERRAREGDADFLAHLRDMYHPGEDHGEYEMYSDKVSGLQVQSVQTVQTVF